MLYRSFRALGYISSGVPVALTSMPPHFYCTTAVGHCFQVYDLSDHLKLVIAGHAPGEIKALATNGEMTFVACETGVFLFKRGKQIKESLFTEACSSVSLHVLGNLLVGLVDGRIIVWDASDLVVKEDLSISSESTFDQLLHPNAYVNKVLVGAQDGSLQLWNIFTKKMLFQFPSFDSPITFMSNTLALDVVAIGCANGSIFLMNIRTSTILESFLQSGRVTGLTFTVNPEKEHVLLSSSNDGSLFAWNVDQRKLAFKLEDAHSGPVSTCLALPGQSVILTAGLDNAVKLWAMDTNFLSLRLWKSREGHFKPPSRVRFSDDGLSVFTSSADGTFRPKTNPTFKSGSSEPSLTPIVSFDCNSAKENTWDSAVTCHSNDSCVRTWSVKKRRIGKNLLFTKDKSFAKVCLVSYCGNFGFVGSASGRIDMFNLQSGIFQRSFLGHKKAVVGLGSSLNNLKLVSGSLEGCLKFWDVKTAALLSTLNLSSPISCIEFHRGSDVIAVACDDLGIRIVDVETFTVIREFWGHRNRILDLAFSPDSRWLVSTSMDSTIRTWDLPLGSCIETRKMSHIATSLAFSPSGNFVATTHVNHLGVYMWTNMSMYSQVNVSRGNEVIDVDLPFIPTADDQERFEEDTRKVEFIRVLTSDDDDHEPVDASSDDTDLIQLASVDLVRFHALLDKEASQKRNKPKEPPKAPALAPFFLMDAATSVKEEKPKDKRGLGFFAATSPFQDALSNGLEAPEVFKIMSDLPPAKLELEIRFLDAELLKTLLRVLSQCLKGNRDYDLVQAYLNVVLKLHGDSLLASGEEEDVVKMLGELEIGLGRSWDGIESMYHTVIAGLEFLRE
ncbi:hypothetical protein HDU67_005051 [Dinochytrium kinnereticum]|nr:hypothetical protein HDU67_005051 [Dinochytrium kinnereticum]